MDFQFIRLSFWEMLLLRRSRSHQIPARFCTRLLHLHLVQEQSAQIIPGGMPVGTGFVCISPLGLDFLAYSSSEFRRSYLRPVIVSFLTAAATSLLTHWLWPQLPQVSTFLSSRWDLLCQWLGLP